MLKIGRNRSLDLANAARLRLILHNAAMSALEEPAGEKAEALVWRDSELAADEDFTELVLWKGTNLETSVPMLNKVESYGMSHWIRYGDFEEAARFDDSVQVDEGT